jgi:putative ABC transport system permease protein
MRSGALSSANSKKIARPISAGSLQNFLADDNMRPRWRKVFLDLAESKTRTALVVFSIAVGVFSIGVIAGAYAIISNDMSASYAATHPANMHLRLENFDSDLVDAISNMKIVSTAEGRRIFSVRARPAGTTQWFSVDVVAVDEFEKMDINLLTPVEGQTFPNKGQVVAERNILKDMTIHSGGALEVQLGDGSLVSFPVVGMVQDPATSAGDFLAPPHIFITLDTLPDFKEPEEFNRLFVNAAENSNDFNHIKQVTSEVKDKIEKSGYEIYRTETSLTNEHPMGSTIEAVLGVLGILGVLIVFLSSSLIANTLSALLNQHLRHIGVMKLIGARRNQVFMMYFVLILIFGLLALLIAVPLGGQGAYGLALFIADQMSFSLLGYRIVPLALIIQIVIAVVIPIGAGLLPVWNGTRITVMRALSGDLAREEKLEAAPSRVSVQDRVMLKVNHELIKRGIHIPRPLLISLRNTFRRRGRLMLTLFTLTMGGAIFIAVFNVRTTLHDYIGSIGNYFLADVTLEFDRPYRLNEVAQVAAQIPGVIYAEGWAFANAELINPDGTVGDNLIILAPPAESTLVNPIMLEGGWIDPSAKKAITISESAKDAFPNLRSGSTIRMKVNGKEDDWYIAGIFKFVGRSQGVVAYANYDYIAHITNFANRSVSYRIVTEQHDLAYQKMKSEEIDRYFRAKGFHVRQVRPGISSLQAASESIDILVYFLLIMAVLTASVGAMGLTGTMGMNVLDRTREIGIMRAIGATDREIMRTVIVEGVVIGSISWLLGAILSFPITYLLSYIVSMAIFNSPIDVIFTWEGFVLWLVLVLILSAIASVLPARNAARLTIREVLAYE